MLQKDDTLQVHVLKPGWKEFVQRQFLHVGAKIQRAPPVSRGSYITLEPNLGLHPEDEDGEASVCWDMG